MFDKLMQAQQKAEEIKKRLDSVSVSGEADGGRIKITATANKYITAVEIHPDLLQESAKEELEELMAIAVNKAIEQAENISQTEMQAATRDMFGGLGNLFGQ